MVKYFVLLFNLLGVLLLSIFSSDVAITVNAPSQVQAGDTFMVEITINKGDISNFARFQHELPIGFTAISGSSANGVFSFKDQKVKFLWLAGGLPAEDEFVISYVVEVDQTVGGIYDITGKFDYVEENQRKTIHVDIVSINVLGGPVADVADDNNQGWNDGGTDWADLNSSDPDKVVCVRQKPIVDKVNNEIVVNVLVNKGNKDQFAKIEETIPEGYTAVAVDTKDAIFNVSGNTVKFLWMNLPAEEKYIVTYKLMPKEETTIGDIELIGSFSYVDESENTQTVEMSEKDIDLISYIQSNVYADVNDNVDNTEVPDNVGDASENVVDNNADDTNDTVEDVSDISNIPDPETGIQYKVQICALQKYRQPTYFNKKRFNLNERVSIEDHEGWHKYTIGSYAKYKSARDHRTEIWNNTPIDDAFVAAYNGGTRITVQEALMIANQQWYK